MYPSLYDVDSLDQQVTELLDASLSTSTKQTYSSALQCFLTFMCMNGVVCSRTSLPSITETTLVYFISHCKSVLKLKYETMKLYLAGIRYYYIVAGLGDVLHNCHRLHYVLRGVKKSQTNQVVKRLPITVQILKELVILLDNGAFSPFFDLMLKCMFLYAFFGFLRCGEITCKNASSVDFVRIEDVSFPDGNNNFVLRLRNSKTDPFSKGVDITIFENVYFKPVHNMLVYVESRKLSACDQSSPLFIESEHCCLPITRDKFIQHLRELLRRSSFCEQNYSGHSFRIGAATTAAAAGVEDHVIKELGRWSSDCYVRYIRTDRQIIQNAQNNMCNASPCTV